MLSRRNFVLGCMASSSLIPLRVGFASAGVNRQVKIIPSTSEKINPIGMGTWITFNVGRDEHLLYQRTKVLSAFFELGGQLIDSSPMYGSSEKVVGHGLEHLTSSRRTFAATKTWSSSVEEGRRQFEDSQTLWGRRQLDLLQVHNLVAWKDQLAMLRELKEQKLVRYIGVTTSHGRRHGELEKIIKSESLDFIQLTYNILDREAERSLLPMAQDKGVAVIANRPFQGGRLFNQLRNHALPSWHAEIGCMNWAQFFLRYIISHPAITCAIPATTQTAHMRQNMQSANPLPLPDEKQRSKMTRYLETL